MSQGELRWNDLEFTWSDADIDFYVIINRPWPGEHYVSARTIVFQMEPWCGEAHQHWGVKTWGEWAMPDPSRFLQVRGHRTHLNNAFWQLKATYKELRTKPIEKSRLLASICSPKYFDPGHIKRVDFLKFLEQKNDDVVRVELYAYDNPLGFTSWVGPHPAGEKDAALLPYRYFFSAENNCEHNFVTEKLWEPLLTETLCFYWGTPNAADWIDPRAFIPINLDNFEQAFATMKRAILDNEWERRIDVIRHEKHKVLERYQFFPTVERVLRHELKLPAHPTDAELTFHKYFADTIGAEIRTAAFIHCLTRSHENLILRALLASIEKSGLLHRLDRLYVINYGDALSLPIPLDEQANRVRLINYSADASRGEGLTLELVRTFATRHQDAQILYVHTKGASYAEPRPSVVDWRALMLHFLVEQHAEARALLDAHDVVGCNLLDRPHRHFSGNFWWANAKYLSKLVPVPDANRHEAERWVLRHDAVRAHSVHNSKVDHYDQRYPRSRYVADTTERADRTATAGHDVGTPLSAAWRHMTVAQQWGRDATALEQATQRSPDNSRSAFQLAQSLFEAGEFDKAMLAYSECTLGGDDAEERFYSLYRVALCMHQTGKSFAELSTAWEACCEQYPHRAEPLVRAAELARQNNNWSLAYAWAKRAVSIAKPGADALFVEQADYEYRALDEQAIAAFYCGHQDEAFAICTELLENRVLPAGERARIEANRDFSVPHIKDALTQYNAALVANLCAKLPVAEPRVTLTITSCKRPGLFVATVCSFINACIDIDLVDRFICVDDNSSDADRRQMQQLFPFFEFILKRPQQSGHAKSMNLIADAVGSPWLVHLEDDWHFFARREYIRPALEIFEHDSKIGQVLFNRNYAETLADREIPGGFLHRSQGSDTRYLLHQHLDPSSDAHHHFQTSHGRGSNAYWPHFSLRPGVWRTSVLARVGRFEASASHFELDYANRYFHAGFCTAFFDGIYALHTGRLTSERGDSTVRNAYQLNAQSQFGETVTTPPASDDLTSSARLRSRVKLVGCWASSADLALAFERQSKGEQRWDDIELTTDDDADYFVLFNHPGHYREHFVEARTVVFQMEPPHAVARWHEWAHPDPRRFIQVRGHDRFANVSEWHLAQTWHGLSEHSPTKLKSISAVVSSQISDPGQALRISFLHWLEAHGIGVDIFGHDNSHGFRRHFGALPTRDKSAGLMPYRYTIAVENSVHDNYFTEKIIDALLSECLPFYWGCPNLATHIDPRAFIPLPLNDFAAARQIIEDAIAHDEWSQRIAVIRSEKRRILDQLQLFPTVARIIRGQQLAERLAIRLVNLDRRTDRLASFWQRFNEAAGVAIAQRVRRFSAVDGLALAHTAAITHLFRGNDFGFRRGVVACALSHLALWTELGNSESFTPAYLIFEDDVTLCQGFNGQLVELCADLEQNHRTFDLALLGHCDWNPSPDDDFSQNLRPARFCRFDGARYIGGAFAYIVSRRGAQRLLAIAERDGIQNGIDRFVHVKEGELELLMATPHVAWSPLAPPASGLDSDIQNDFEAL